MATDNSKHRGKIDENNLNEWMRSSGFLFPNNELELTRFDELYADYDYKLKNATIDVRSIIDGNLCSIDKIFTIDKGEELIDEIEELKMVARKGLEVPKHIIEKMRQKHRKNNDGKE